MRVPFNRAILSVRHYGKSSAHVTTNSALFSDNRTHISIYCLLLPILYYYAMSKKRPNYFLCLAKTLYNIHTKFSLKDYVILLIEHFHNDYKTMSSIHNQNQ